jgi:ParB family transcriptional regulator, chromosome partitioning protein
MTHTHDREATPRPRTDLAPERQEQTIRLGDLGIARENLRAGDPPDDDIPLLATTLKAAGQLYPVTVRPGRGRKEEPWMALDGRRRRLAWGLLLDAGDIDLDHPVRAYVETDPARQAAAIVLTNTALPVHVADVVAAIGRMLKSKLSVAAISKALGYAELEIKRLAALSALPVTALDAMKAGRLTLRQAKLLARLPDPAEQIELAEAALSGHGFQDWRILERLDQGQVTIHDRRCALVDAAAYAAAGGRSETDLFGERAPVLLDPEVLTRLWTERVGAIAAVFEAEGLTVHVTAGPEPDLPDDLEPLGYVYAGSLPAEDMARYRAERDILQAHAETVRAALSAEDRSATDDAIVAMIRARIALDQTGCGGRVVTTLVLWPAVGTGVDVRCYTPQQLEDDAADPVGDALDGVALEYTPPQVEAPEPETQGVTHALHAARTEVATRGLIRALADDPGAALVALIARLFGLLVADVRRGAPDGALTIRATAFAPAGGRVIDALDGAVRDRLETRRLAWEESGETVIAWISGLPYGEKMALLAELTALSLDAQETRTTLIRRRARAEAVELARLCGADIALHWTPDAPFLQRHSKAQLLEMLETMGAVDDHAATLPKAELVDWVAGEAASRGWAPSYLSWTSPDDADGPAEPLEQDGAGAFAVTPAGEAALHAVAAA